MAQRKPRGRGKTALQTESDPMRAKRLAEDIVATMREPLLVLDASLRVHAASRSFCELFQLTPQNIENRFFYELGQRQWDNPDLRQRLQQTLQDDKSFSDYSISQEFPGLGRRIMLLNARRLLQDEEQKPLILLAIEDVTAREEQQSARLSRAERSGRTEELALSNPQDQPGRGAEDRRILKWNHLCEHV